MTEEHALLAQVATRARERAREAEAETAEGAEELSARIAAALVAQGARERARGAPPAARRGSVRALGIGAGTALALAAALALWARSAGPGAPLEDAPEYVVAVAGHGRSTRSPEPPAEPSAPREASLEGAPNAQEVVLRPRRPWSRDLEVRAWVARPSGLESLESRPEISERGAVRLRIAPGALVGATEVRIVIAPRGQMGGAATAALAAKGPLPSGPAAFVVLPVVPPGSP